MFQQQYSHVKAFFVSHILTHSLFCYDRIFKLQLLLDSLQSQISLCFCIWKHSPHIMCYHVSRSHPLCSAEQLEGRRNPMRISEEYTSEMVD